MYVHVQSLSYNSESVTVRALFSRSLRARDTTVKLAFEPLSHLLPMSPNATHTTTMNLATEAAQLVRPKHSHTEQGRGHSVNSNDI